MIAVDTSSLRRFLDGSAGDDVTLVGKALAARQAILPPVVVAEILSDPQLPEVVARAVSAIPRLAISEGYWERAGALRAKVIATGHKSKIADALIAQICIDHGLPLITNDRDFRHYERLGLALA